MNKDDDVQTIPPPLPHRRQHKGSNQKKSLQSPCPSVELSLMALAIMVYVVLGKLNVTSYIPFRTQCQENWSLSSKNVHTSISQKSCRPFSHKLAAIAKKNYLNKWFFSYPNFQEAQRQVSITSFYNSSKDLFFFYLFYLFCVFEVYLFQ